MIRTTLLGLAALAFLAVPALHAQEAEEDADQWSAEAGLALNSSGGNEELTVFATNVGLTHLRTDVFEFAIAGRFRYGHSEGEKVAENTRGETSLDLWPQATWSPFLFASAEQDPFKRLDLRLNGGAGAKRTFWQQGDFSEISLSTAILYSYENLAVPDSLGDGVSQTARWSFRGRGRLQVGEGSRIEQVVFFQPAYDRLEDYQLESVTTVRVALSEQLSFTTGLLYQRDNTPAPDVKPDDYSITVGLSMATQW